MDMMIFTS